MGDCVQLNNHPSVPSDKRISAHAGVCPSTITEMGHEMASENEDASVETANVDGECDGLGSIGLMYNGETF